MAMNASDEGFLEHLQALDNSYKEALREAEMLAQTRVKLTHELELAKEERDQAGKSHMLQLSESAALEAKSYELRLKRSNLEQRLAATLQEEVHIREDIRTLGDQERHATTKKNVQETCERLLEAARDMDKEEALTEHEHVGPTRFEVQRAANMLSLLRQELNQTKASLQMVKQSELNLLRRHDEERQRGRNSVRL